ncbi:MAG: hypothetical protein ACOC1F_11745 [Myxococcota bacterium]
MLASDLDGSAAFTEEAADGFLAAASLVEEELEGHPLAELDVARFDDDAHATCAEQSAHLILAGEQLALDDGGGVARGVGSDGFIGVVM